MSNETTTPKPAPATATGADPQLKQPEKSHMHSKDAQLKGDTAREDAKKPS